MMDLIRKRDIDYILAPIAPVLKGEKVHYEYVAFRKQIEDISPVPAIPIPDNATNGDMIKALFPDIEINNGNMKVYTAIPFGDYVGANIDAMKDWWHSPYKRGETE